MASRKVLPSKDQSSDVIKLRGAIEYALKRADTGEVIARGWQENTVLSTGRTWILKKLMFSTNQTFIDRIYLGTCNTAANSTQAGILNSAASQTFNVGTTDNSTSAAPHSIFCASWNSNETFTNSSVINEIGLYASSGTAVGRYVTGSQINFGPTNTLTVSYTLSN